MVEEREKTPGKHKPYPLPPHVRTSENKARTLALITAVLCSAIVILGSAQLASYTPRTESSLSAIMHAGEHRWALTQEPDGECIGYFRTVLKVPENHFDSGGISVDPEELFSQSTDFELEGLLPLKTATGTYLTPIQLTAKFNAFFRLDGFEGQLLSGESALLFQYSVKKNEFLINRAEEEAPLYRSPIKERILLYSTAHTGSYSLSVPQEIEAGIEEITQRSSAALQKLSEEDVRCEDLPPFIDGSDTGFAFAAISDPLLIEIIDSSLLNALDATKLTAKDVLKP